jgi:hypothetical protein
MQFRITDNKFVEFLLDRDELGVMRAVLLEVGFNGASYDNKRPENFPLERVEAMFEAIAEMYDKPDDNFILSMSFNELKFIIDSIAWTTEDLTFEFQTLTGYYIEEANIVRNKLLKVLDEVKDLLLDSESELLIFASPFVPNEDIYKQKKGKRYFDRLR